MYPKFEHLRMDSFHFHIHFKEERLLYYPIYVLEYNYRSEKNFMCFFDGLTGCITGDRQYSFAKVTLATLVGFYPIAKFGLFAFGSLANLLFAFEIIEDFTFISSLPVALIVAPCLGAYARSYPASYRRSLSQEQWATDQSKVEKFTYDSLAVKSETQSS